jgi:RimJ/RimL family protein N-acetyltransferase
MAGLAPWWPIDGLRVRTPRLELRPFTDEDLAAYAELLDRPIHDPATMPFNVPWTRPPAPQRQRQALQWQWLQRATWQPDAWDLELGVWADVRLVGSQGMQARDFSVLRSVLTGSWLTQAEQGRGLGKEMRAAILHLAFAGLGAEHAETEAYADNPRSLGVTRALGYEPNGTGRRVREGQAAELHRFVLDRAAWERRRRDDIEIEGLDGCREMFGA